MAILFSTSFISNTYNRYLYNWENKTLMGTTLQVNKARGYLFCAAASKYKGATTYIATAGPDFLYKLNWFLIKFHDKKPRHVCFIHIKHV